MTVTVDASDTVLTSPSTAPAPAAERGALGHQRRRHRRIAVTRWSLRLGSLVIAVLIWHVLTVNDVHAWMRFSKVPEPLAVRDELWRQLRAGELTEHVVASTRRILTGFGLAAGFGVAVGVLTGRSRAGGDLLRPLMEVIRPIPAIAWVPLAILLFPTGEQGILFITLLAAFFPVAVSTRHAVEALPEVWEDAARTMGASRLAVLWRVILPGAMPGIFAGLSVAMGVAWICVVSAEMISGQFGVGYYTWMSYSLINYEGVIVGMLTIGALGLLSSGVVELAGRWWTRWLPRSERR